MLLRGSPITNLFPQISIIFILNINFISKRKFYFLLNKARQIVISKHNVHMVFDIFVKTLRIQVEEQICQLI